MRHGSGRRRPGVGGNTRAEDPARGNVYADSFVGSTPILQSGVADITWVVIDGDLQSDENAMFLSAANNTIDRNLQAVRSTGGLSIVRNRIGENLQCQENVPPSTGGGNVVEGDMEDQCPVRRRSASACVAPRRRSGGTAVSGTLRRRGSVRGTPDLRRAFS